MVKLPRVLFFATILSSATGLAVAQHPAGTPPAAPAHGKPDAKKDSYAVVSIDGKLSVMTEAAVEARKKELHDAYDKQLADYTKSRQAALAAKQAFDQKPPKLGAITVKKNGFATEALASAFLTEQEKAHSKPKDAPNAKDAGHSKRPGGSGK